MFKGRSILLIGLVSILTFVFLGTLINFVYLTIPFIVQLAIVIIISILTTMIILKKEAKRTTDSHRLSRQNVRVINFVTVIVGLFVVVATPFFQSTWFYVRHSVLFILIAFLLFFNGYRLGVKFMENYPSKIRVIKGVHLASLFIGVLLLGNLQLAYIKNYEIPPLYGCSYYDSFGNLIYNSQVAGSCPTLEKVETIETGEGSSLSFTVHEEIHRYDDDLIKDRIIKDKFYYDSKITYHYDQQHRVVKYDIDLTKTGYYFDDDHDEYFVYRKTEYKKTIDNVYENNRLVSNHRISNTVTDEDGKIEFLSYDVELQYISELGRNVDNEYEIEVTRMITENSESTSSPLYSIDLFQNNGEYTYLVYKTNSPEYLVLSVEERPGYSDELQITKDYRASIYGIFRTQKELYFNNSISRENNNVFVNDFSRYDPYISTDVDYDNDHIIRTTSGDIFDQDFYNFTNIVEDTDFGFKISHYHLQREQNFSYNTYKNTVDYNIDSPNNGLSIDLEDINSYERSLFYPDFYGYELIYQDNPLLLRRDVENLN